MHKLKATLTKLAIAIFIFLPMLPFLAMGACADRPVDGKYCSLEKTWHYLSNGADVLFWGTLAFCVIFVTFDFDDEDPADEADKDSAIKKDDISE